MINILLFSSVFVFSVVMVNTSYAIRGINSTLNGYGITIAQNAIECPKDLKEAPYFNTELFEDITNRYFVSNLSRYIGKEGGFEIVYKYDDEIIPGLLSKDMVKDGNPQIASFHIRIDYGFFYNLEKDKVFAVKEGKTYGW